ncbi:tripartite motif-containing protein 64-like [Callospermophilus lateralis]
MDSHALQDFQSALTCSTCMNYFLEPVTIDCGHTLYQPCLYFCWDEAQTPRQARPRSDSNSGEQLCRRTGETKGLFCEVDKSLLSAPCSESPEHAVHSYSPEACVVEENRDYVVLRRNMIKVQYQMMQRFLLEEERFQLETLEREAQEILQQLRDSAIRMAQHREKLKEMYRELTELCHKSDMELLQVTKDLGDIFERIKLLELQKLQPVNPELSSLHTTGILDMLNKFRVHNGLIQRWANHYMSLPDEVRNRCLELMVQLGIPKHWRVMLYGVLRPLTLGGCGEHLQLDYRPAGRVGVFLAYENETLSFYDVCRGSLIYSSFSSSFTSPLTPIFVFGSP